MTVDAGTRGSCRRNRIGHFVSASSLAAVRPSTSHQPSKRPPLMKNVGAPLPRRERALKVLSHPQGAAWTRFLRSAAKRLTVRPSIAAYPTRLSASRASWCSQSERPDYKSKDSRETGLGLAIAQQLVILPGGRVVAESPLRQRTTIRFTLPLADRSG